MDLSDFQLALVDRVGKMEEPLDQLVRAFPDPADAYICSPIPLSMKELARLYASQDDARETGDDEEIFDKLRRFRERSKREQWQERRAVYQAKRSDTRRDAILNAEAQVIAIFAVEFQSRAIRSLFERWETLDSYVRDRLAQCETGRIQFTAVIRDACAELRNLEEQMAEKMPDLNTRNKAEEFWTRQAGERSQMIERIGQRLGSLAGREQAANVLHLVEAIDSEDAG